MTKRIQIISNEEAVDKLNETLDENQKLEEHIEIQKHHIETLRR